MTADVDADGDGAGDGKLAECFRTLADETRIRILDVLASAAGTGDLPLSYSTLRSRAGVRDKGRFNYHLSELDGEFLARTDEGYAPLPAGRFAHLVTTAYDVDADDPVRMDAGADCHHCGGALVARHAPDHAFVVDCPACERVYLSLDVPFARPGGAAPSAFLDAMDATARERFALLARGLCPWCRSPVETGVETGPPAGDGRRPRRCHVDVRFRHRCVTCATVARTTPGELLLAHPEHVALRRRQGRAHPERYVWAVPFAVTDRAVSVRSRDPWRIVLRTTVGGSEVECVLDGEGDARVLSTRNHLRGV